MKQAQIRDRHIEKVNWAIWFCQVDLDTLREGDLLNLKQDLYGFVYPSWLSYDEKDKQQLQEWLDKKLGETIPKVQARLKDYIEAVINGGTEKRGTFANIIAPGSSVQIPITGYIGLHGFPDLPFSQVFRSDNMGRRVELAVGTHLVQSGIIGSQIRICPTCHRIFLSRRKPRADKKSHCSVRCSQLVATHRYRKKNKKGLRLKEKQRSRRRYEEKVRGQPGKAKVKIARRPRKTRGA